MGPHFRFSTIARLFLCAWCLVAATSARAQILLTVSGTAADDAHGYTFEESYSLSFLLNPAFAGQLDDNAGGFDGGYVAWWQASPSRTPVFTNIFGSAVQGTFASTTDEPDVSMSLWSDGRLNIYHDYSDGAPLGLYTIEAEDPVAIGKIVGQLDAPFATSATYPTSYVDPATYWSNLLGTHEIAGQLSLKNSVGQDLMIFNTTSLTVADLAAVPEPATWAALSGTAALAVAYRRRRASRS